MTKLEEDETQTGNSLSEMKLAEGALLPGNEHCSKQIRSGDFVDFVSDCVISINREHFITHANAATADLFGHAAEDLVGEKLDVLIPENFRARHSSYIKEFEKTGLGERVMSSRECMRGLTKDGTVIPLEISIINHPEGSSQAFTAICRDATLRESLEEKVKSRDAQLSQAQSLASLGSWKWCLGSNDVIWSDELYAILGMDKEKTVASIKTYIERVHPDDQHGFQQVMDHFRNTARAMSIRHGIVTGDGVEKVVSGLIEPEWSRNGKMTGIRGTVQDVTALWKNETRLKQKTKEAQKASEAKAQFLMMMSHELRTPLNAIIGLGEVLETSLENQNVKEQDLDNVKVVRKSGEHLLTMIDNILDMSQAESSGIDVFPESVTGEMLSDYCAEKLGAKARSKDVEVIHEISDDMPDLWLDGGHCRQILLNLVDNAISFSEPGGTVWLRMRKTADSILWEVEDHGIGFEPQQAERAFDPFSQSDMSVTRSHDGLGIGLTIAKRLVELQSGTIALASKPGQGSCLSILFPLSVADLSDCDIGVIR